jgi:isopentenyl-diphosphate delta-isomerase
MLNHSERKRAHLRIVAEEAVAMQRLGNGLERWRPAYDPMPELDLGAVDASTGFLGRRLSFPFLIAAVSGGVEEGAQLNRRLARVAARVGVGLELGSLRPLLESRDEALLAGYDVRDLLGGGLLIGNLGATALRELEDLSPLLDLVRRLRLDALSLHVNPLHEAFQEDGTTGFAGLGERVAALARVSPVPLGLKTIGFGASRRAIERLLALPVAYLELHGAGGTSFTRVESFRLRDPVKRAAIGDFLDFGVPVEECLGFASARAPGFPILAGGGLRGGLDLFKVLALGASLGCAAAPVVQAALLGDEPLITLLEGWRYAFRTALFVTGCASVAALKARGLAALERVP